MAVCRSWLLAARCATAFQLLKGPISGTSHLADGRGEEQKSAEKNFNYSPAQGTFGHSFGYPFLYFDNPVAIKNGNTQLRKCFTVRGEGEKPYRAPCTTTGGSILKSETTEAECFCHLV